MAAHPCTRRTPPPAPAVAAHAHWLAAERCFRCGGSGRLPQSYCGCVYRAIARQVLHRWRAVAASDRFPGRRDLTAWNPGAARRVQWRAQPRTDEEYAADVEAIARRVLNPRDRRIWERYYVREMHWSAAAGGAGRFAFYSMVRMIEIRLGRAWAETRPYPVWPVAAYYSGGAPLPAAASLDAIAAAA